MNPGFFVGDRSIVLHCGPLFATLLGMMRLSDDDVVVLQRKLPRLRLRMAVALAGTSYAALAARAGLSRAHLASAAQGRQTLSLTSKLRVARALGIAPRVVWPALEALGNELLHGAAWRRER
jgi:lambda repressor-like predicted transcriptional regulator